MICKKAVMLHSGGSASDLLLSDHGSYIVWKHERTLWLRETNIMGVRKCCFLFLGMFVKLQKVIISFIMSVRPHGTTQLPLNGFL
jgi:hypothetical protein